MQYKPCERRGLRMASVFLSYDHDDEEKAKPIALALEKAGHVVWWDLHIKGGAQFGKVIEKALADADAVVVLWSKNSIDSAWVRDEAGAGRDSGRLVPATIDGAQPPLGFRQFHTIDLARWKGRKGDSHLAQLLDAISANDRSTNPEEPSHIAPVIGSRSGRGSTRLFVLVTGTVPLLLIGAAVAWLAIRPAASSPSLAVSAAAPTAASNALARELLVRLGELQSVTGGNLRLIGTEAQAGTGSKPTLRFEVGATRADGKSKASLVLLDGRDGSLMWSRNFEQSISRQADLEQQFAYTAARVLGCALDGVSAGQPKLAPETLKLYLNGCAASTEIGDGDVTPVVRIMRRVVSEEPKFAPAWALLIFTESEDTRPETNIGRVAPAKQQILRQHLEAARKIDPDLPELSLGELALMPRRNFGQAIELMDRAIEEHPDNPVLLSYRGPLLQSVGRSRDAIKDARRVFELDPISPYALNGLIAALAYGGQIDAARTELARAERLWPGTVSLRDAQSRFHFRFGDPQIALAMIAAEDRNRGEAIYLQARMDPSPANIAHMMAYIRERIKVVRSAGLSVMIQSYAEFGQINELYEQLLNWPNVEDLAIVGDLYFRPGLKAARNDPRFMKLAQRAGLLTYWIESGQWPDFCSEPDLPYDCKAEAAKLH